MNIEDYLKVVGDYADQIGQADQIANRDTMAVAEAMDAMYESRAWVAEWLEQDPRPANGGSNRWTADSRNRFAQWQAWKLEQSGRRPLNGRYTYLLLDGARVVKAIPNLNSVQIRTEFQVRPLKWMLKYRYENRIPEVWAIAVDLAGSPDRVTAVHTREALAAWKRTNLGTGGVKSALRVAKANRLRVAAEAKFDELAALALVDQEANDELRALIVHIENVLRAGAR